MKKNIRVRVSREEILKAYISNGIGNFPPDFIELNAEVIGEKCNKWGVIPAPKEGEKGFISTIAPTKKKIEKLEQQTVYVSPTLQSTPINDPIVNKINEIIDFLDSNE